jgi:hypothetical protein
VAGPRHTGANRNDVILVVGEDVAIAELPDRWLRLDEPGHCDHL